MTTTVRSVRVELELGIASYITNAATAGRVTEHMADRMKRSALKAGIEVRDLDSSVGDLGKSSAEAKVQQTELARSVDRVGTSTGKAGPAIDRYSGRLRALVDMALIGGPALLRLGAGSLPAVTAGLVGLGAAAGGIGVAALALNGVGDALKAISEARNDPTAANLQKKREELEKLGPAAQDLARYLADLEPGFRRVQDLAGAEMFPGLKDGIDDLLTRGPQVQRILADLADGVGDIARESGEGLASERWTPFFDYIESQARPTMDAFAQSTGNVALGLANMLVAFDPVTQRFTRGLEDMTDRFAAWSEELEHDQGFQDFLGTVRDAGPEVVEFAGASAKAIGGLVQAAAPVGATVLPALTALAEVFGAVASSPIGPVLYTGTVALIGFSRASSLVERGVARIEAGATRLGTSLNTPATQLEKIGKTAAGIAAVGIAVGAIADSVGRIDSTTLDRSLEALGRGEITDNIDQIVTSLENLTATRNKVDLGEVVTAGGLFGDTSLDKYADNLKQVDQALASMVESGDGEHAAEILAQIQEQAAAAGVSASQVAGFFEQYQIALGNLGSELSGETGLLFGMPGALDDYAGATEGAAEANESLRTSIHRAMDAMRQQRQEALAAFDAQTAYRQAMKDAAEQAEESNAGIRGNSDAALENRQFLSALAGAWNGLDSATKNAAGNYKVARQNFIETAREMGVGKKTAEELADALLEIPRSRETKFSTPGAEESISKAQTLKSILDSLKSKDIYVALHYQTIRNKPKAPIPGDPNSSADGGTVPKTGLVYADRHPYLLADGEEVISNRHGQADRNRGLLKAINAGRLADGGTAERIATYTRRQAGFNLGGGPLFDVMGAADGAARGLKGLEKAADKVQASYEKEKAKLDDLISQRSSTASSIASAAVHDPFGNGLAGLDAQVEADTNDIEAMSAALATLVRNGLDPKSALYQQLAASMDVNTAQQLAQLSAGELAVRAQRFQNRSDEAAALGGTVAGQQFNEAIRDQTRATHKLENRLQSLESAIRDLKNLPKHVGDATFVGARDGTREGAHAGTQAGQEGRNQTTASFVRTGGRRR